MNKMELAFFEEQYNTAVAAKDKLLLKTGVCAIAALLFALLTASGLGRVTLGIVEIVATVAVWAICREEITDGLRSFLKLTPATNSFHALASLATLAHGVFLIATPDPINGESFAAVLFASLTVSMGMRWLYVLQIVKNLDLIRDKKTYALQVSDLSLSKKYIRKVCSANPVVDFPNVLRTTLDHNPAEKKNRTFVPLVTLGVIGVSVAVSLIRDGALFPSLCALLLICASFSSELAFCLPYALTQMKLRKLGSILMGNYSVEQIKETDTLLVKDTDLFPQENNEVLHVRIRVQERSDEALGYAAALLRLSDSPLQEAFRAAVPESWDRNPNVLQWRVIKNYGIVATVDIDNVLLGNRNLMLSHNLRPWSNEKEAMLTAVGVHMMYLAVNGRIVATFICRYGEDPELKRSAELLGGDFNLLVDTKDCNVNETMIQRRYDLSRTKISVPDPDEAESLVETREEMEEDQSPPVMISTRNALGILESIRRAKILHGTVGVTIVLQQLSVLFGLILTTVALLIAPEKMNVLWLFLFNVIWALPAPAVALFRKQ